MVALSSLVGSGATGVCSYDWGLPKFSKGMPFTDVCSSTIYCVCCKAWCGNSKMGCASSVWDVQLWPLGDNCFFVGHISKWGVYGQVFAIGTDGSTTAMGDWRCVHDWGYACHCDFTACNCYTTANMCCVSSWTSMWTTSDADGRLYIQQAHGFGGSEAIFPDNLWRCVHLHHKCWDSSTCTWTSVCTYSNGTFDAPYSGVDFPAGALVNVRKGVVLAKACWCNCFNRARHYAYVKGVRSLQTMNCNSACNDQHACAFSFFTRTGSCSWAAIPAYGGSSFTGGSFAVDMTTCAVSSTATYRSWCMPHGGGCFNCGPWPNIGINPQSGTSIDLIAVEFTCNTGPVYHICNYYVNNNGCVWGESIANSCGSAAIPGCVCLKSQLFYTSYVTASSGYACGASGLCCALLGYGHTLKNGYPASSCGRSMYDVQPITAEADYAPFTFTLGSIGLIDGIQKKFGCTCCTADVILVGDKWVVQLCCGGGSPPACHWYLKHNVMAYSSEC